MTFSVDSDLNGASPQFTLTCISTGGPATTVTWTRDSVTVTEGTETVLDNRTTSQYTHTLTVTGRLGGLYTCNVTNNKPSNAVAQLTVEGMYMCHDELTLVRRVARVFPILSNCHALAEARLVTAWSHDPARICGDVMQSVTGYMTPIGVFPLFWGWHHMRATDITMLSQQWRSP